MSPRVALLLMAVLPSVTSWTGPSIGELQHAAAHRATGDSSHAVATAERACSPMAHWHAAIENACDTCLACLERSQPTGAPDQLPAITPASVPVILAAVSPPPPLARQRGATRGRAPPRA